MGRSALTESSVEASSLTSAARVAVVMQRRAIDSRWATEAWEVAGVLQDYPEDAAAGSRVLVDLPSFSQWLYPGFDIVLQRAEAQGYFHNITADVPSLFVLWRMEGARAVPHYVSASYDEASRWMDGGAQVDSVAMPAGMRERVREFVERHYQPEPRKRKSTQSFLAPRDRGPA
jgi:hypothetical protein